MVLLTKKPIWYYFKCDAGRHNITILTIDQHFDACYKLIDSNNLRAVFVDYHKDTVLFCRGIFIVCKSRIQNDNVEMIRPEKVFKKS